MFILIFCLFNFYSIFLLPIKFILLTYLPTSPLCNLGHFVGLSGGYIIILVNHFQDEVINDYYYSRSYLDYWSLFLLSHYLAFFLHNLYGNEWVGGLFLFSRLCFPIFIVYNWKQKMVSNKLIRQKPINAKTHDISFDMGISIFDTKDCCPMFLLLNKERNTYLCDLDNFLQDLCTVSFKCFTIQWWSLF